MTGSPRHSFAAAAAGLALLTLASALPNVQLRDRENVGDTRLYQLYGENVRDGLWPYGDFYLEYPPAAVPILVAPTVGEPGDYAQSSKAIQWFLAAACLLLALLALVPAVRAPRDLYLAAGLIAVAPALLGRVTFTRFDFWPAVLTVGALALAVRSRHVAAAVTLAAATAAKVYPVVVLPLLLLRAARAGGALRALVAFSLAAAAIVAPFAVAGAGGLRHTLSVQLDRPLQIESLGASILLALGQLGVYEPEVVSSHGSQNLTGTLPATVSAFGSLVSLLVLAAVWLWFRSGRTGPASAGPAELLTATAAAVAVFVAFGRVLSPQYLIWLIPLVPLARGRRGLAAALLLLLALGLTQVWAQGRYGDVVDLEPIVWVVLARNLVLVAVAALLVSEVARGRRAPPPVA